MPPESLCIPPQVEVELMHIYRDYFNRAEKKRRWSLVDDIPWEDVNSCLSPAIADVVESFLAVEMHLPDYVASAMMRSRPSRACSWFYANWGYEESKHSLALSDWLVKSKLRSDEEMTDLDARVLAYQWDVPYQSPVGMLAYAMVQELATGLTYRKLRVHVDREGDLALSRLLGFLSVDEQAHYNFFLRAIRLFLRHDRQGTLTHLHQVLHQFSMPAIHELADGRRRVQAIKDLGIFDERSYHDDVYEPILASLGINRPELRKVA